MKSQPDISQYNEVTGKASSEERQGNYADAWRYWLEACAIAGRRNWRAKIEWCEARADFCARQLKLEEKRK